MLRFLSALALAAALAIPAFAQPAPAPPAERLATLTAEALRRSPALAAARAEVEARRELEAPAGTLPDPMLETVLQNVRVAPNARTKESPMLGFEARQGLPYPGKRAAARAAASTETARAVAALQSFERRLMAQVETLYARIYALDRERETLDAATELIDLLEQVAHGRYEAGEGESEGILKVQIEGLKNTEKLNDLAHLRRATVADLNRLLDRPGEAPFGPVGALPESYSIGVDGAEAERLAVASSAEVALAATGVKVAERYLDLARLAVKPDFSAGVGIAFRDGQDPTVSARFGIELPFWRRQKQLPRFAAAQWQLEAVRHELADAEAEARAEAARWLSARANAERQATLYREGILPETSAALDAARSSYLNGRGDFSTVIEDFALWLDARVALARREADRFIANAELNLLAGHAPGGILSDTSEEQP